MNVRMERRAVDHDTSESRFTEDREWGCSKGKREVKEEKKMADYEEATKQ